MEQTVLIKGGAVVTMDAADTVFEGDVLDLAVTNRVVEKAGAWFSYNGERLGQGRENSKTTLRENPEMLGRIQNDVKKALGMPVHGDEAEEAEAAKK